MVVWRCDGAWIKYESGEGRRHGTLWMGFWRNIYVCLFSSTCLDADWELFCSLLSRLFCVSFWGIQDVFSPEFVSFLFDL